MKAFIFDLDGVIVFTDQLHYQAWKQIADGMGIYFDEKINHRLRGVSRLESLEIILQNYDGQLSDREKAQLMQKKNDIYCRLLMRLTPQDVAKEVSETLKQLKHLGYRLAIGSSSRNAKLILEQVGLTAMFDAVSDGHNITHSKPHPEVFLKAAEFIGCKPKDCCVIEDACAGIDAAGQAGMVSIGIGAAADYEKADYRIQSLSEILVWI